MRLKNILAVVAVSLIVSGCAPSKEITLDLGNKVTMKLMLIPAGKFLMGSPNEEEGRWVAEGPQHEVTISKPFYMGIYTVTQAQYQQVMGKNPSEFKGASNPMEQVSWEDAVEFCKALSRKTGKTVRLPTEAEWEYACRAGTTTPFNTGQTINTDQANYDGTYGDGGGKKGPYRQKTTPVGSFKPNAFGLYDMHGNVDQWCSDRYDDKYYAVSPKTDPQGPKGPNLRFWRDLRGGGRVLRGGAWYNNPVNCRSAFRYRLEPGLRISDGIGFRVVVLPDDK